MERELKNDLYLRSCPVRPVVLWAGLPGYGHGRACSAGKFSLPLVLDPRYVHTPFPVYKVDPQEYFTHVCTPHTLSPLTNTPTPPKKRQTMQCTSFGAVPSVDLFLLTTCFYSKGIYSRCIVDS